MLPSGTHYPRIRIRTGPHMLDENPATATTGSRTEVWCRLVAACCSQSLGQEVGVSLQALLPTPKLATTARAAAQMLCNPEGPASMSLQVESWHNDERAKRTLFADHPRSVTLARGATLGACQSVATYDRQMASSCCLTERICSLLRKYCLISIIVEP